MLNLLDHLIKRRSPLANQVRIVLHTVAYWLMLKLRDAIPRPLPLTKAEFATLRQHVIKIGARVSWRPPTACGLPSPRPISSRTCAPVWLAAFTPAGLDAGGNVLLISPIPSTVAPNRYDLHER